MEKLKRYDNFKSMKDNASAKMNKTTNINKKVVDEMTTFLKLLGKVKPTVPKTSN